MSEQYTHYPRPQDSGNKEDVRSLAKSCKYRSSILKSSYLPVPFISGTNAGEKSRVEQNKTRYSVHTVFISSFAVPGNESKGVYP